MSGINFQALPLPYDLQLKIAYHYYDNMFSGPRGPNTRSRMGCDAKCNELTNIRDSIELMPKFNQVEILRILTQQSQDVTINENKYGIHINMSELSDSVVNELRLYINYVKSQEFQLNQNEQQKETFKNTYFVKGVKDT